MGQQPMAELAGLQGWFSSTRRSDDHTPMPETSQAGAILVHVALSYRCKCAFTAEAAREAAVQDHEEVLGRNAIESGSYLVEVQHRFARPVNVGIDRYEIVTWCAVTRERDDHQVVGVGLAEIRQRGLHIVAGGLVIGEHDCLATDCVCEERSQRFGVVARATEPSDRWRV